MTFVIENTITGFETAESLKVGVVADTHIPDRVDKFHPQLMQTLQDARVDIILHAGDICTQAPLDLLGTIAPVFAVRGNRDLLFSGSLPNVRQLSLAGHKIALLHGHGKWKHYFYNKLRMMFAGYQLKIFIKTITEPVPDADIVIFGHTHRPVNFWYNNQQLLFNPGSCSLVPYSAKHPSIGLIELKKGEQAKGEIVVLKEARLHFRRWETT
jgi:putative phosphoesterase